MLNETDQIHHPVFECILQHSAFQHAQLKPLNHTVRLFPIEKLIEGTAQKESQLDHPLFVQEECLCTNVVFGTVIDDYNLHSC